MSAPRFQPIDAELLCEKADDLTVTEADFLQFADPREDRDAYIEILQDETSDGKVDVRGPLAKMVPAAWRLKLLRR